MDAADVRGLALFDGLDDGQLERLVAGGDEVPFEAGAEMFREGEPAESWWVLVDGALDLVRHVGREDVLVGRMDTPGRWAGGFRAWDDEGVYLATARATTAGRLLRVPAATLRALTSEWFPFGGHLVEGLYRTARAIESTARQGDALVRLGTLAAGLAHEINNPASAASRATDELTQVIGTLLESLRRLADGDITAAQFGALDDLRRELDGGMGAAPPTITALELADLEDELADWLGAHGVEHDWAIAPVLAGAGADVDWCARAAAVFGDEHRGGLEVGLQWVASTLSATSLLAEVKDSTRRISELVSAVRSYSQMDRAAMQRVDVTEGLESTLVMLGHKLGPGVTVVREYDESVAPIDAYAGELNQVWTSLIDNAVDAMDGAGTLTLTTRSDGGTVVVEVTDSGPGMAPEVAARAFEAFYTTKSVGHGTGLGLDIARRIVVERHGGTIAIDSRPERTVLRVTLPVRHTPA